MADEPADTETRLDRLEHKLDELLSAGHAKATEHEAEHLDRPSSVAEQVRLELERKDREAAAAADKDAEKTERQTLAQRLAKLEERPPAQPQPKRQRFLWGPR